MAKLVAGIGTGAATGSGASTSTIISKRHPNYSSWLGKWEFFLESYVGGIDYANNNLFKYFKEGDTEFSDRKARSYRENHTKRVVDLINTYLFKEDAVRKTDNKYLTEFTSNFDGSGKTVNRFMKNASQWASVLGRIYIVVDKAVLPDDQITNTQADNLNVLPYCYTIYPQDVLDIVFDDSGKVAWALIREFIRENDDNPYTASDEIKEQYRLWEKGQWTLFNDAGAAINSGETKIDVVPIVIIDNEEQEDLSGQSLIGDIAYIDRAIFNNWSRLDTIVCDQTFSQLIFPVEGLPADVITDENLRKQFLTLATNRIILYSAQAGSPPQFISPDAGQATFILTMLEKQTKQLYATIGLQAETGTEVHENSGVAKSYDFDKLNKLLATKADSLEQGEKEIYEIATKWMNISAEIEVEYPDEFDVKSLTDEIAVAQELALLNISSTFMQEIHKNIAHKALPKVETETMTKITEEIEANAKADGEAAKAAFNTMNSPTKRDNKEDET